MEFSITLNAQDILLINAVVSEQNSQLSSLVSQIASVDSAIQKFTAIRARLEENSAQVRKSLLAHQSLISFARRIPPEVLGEIFYHCLPKTPYIIPKGNESPMVLTRVCRRWRNVAISTPHLWSSLSIHLEKIARDPCYRRGCETWLARAKSVPLFLRAFNDINIIAQDPTLVSFAVHWLRHRISHCIDLWWHGPSLPTLFIPDPGTEFNIPLERICITTYRDCPSIYLPGPALQLRSASLHCFNYDLQTLDGIELPWAHLAELNMHFGLVSSLLFPQILTRCNHLHTLTISCLSAEDVHLNALRALATGSIVQNTLRRIEIKVIQAGLDAILDALTLPALEDLDICFCYRERDQWPHASFVEMVSRSRCALKRLTVRSNKDAVLHFEEYVRAMPGLAVFTSAPNPPSR